MLRDMQGQPDLVGLLVILCIATIYPELLEICMYNKCDNQSNFSFYVTVQAEVEQIDIGDPESLGISFIYLFIYCPCFLLLFGDKT